MATIDPHTAPEEAREWLARMRPIIDRELDIRLQRPAAGAQDGPDPLWEAMRYGALSPGKRLRPALVLAACEAVGGDREHALPAAVAVELLHASSLVHDDLPALDNDVERRGRPTVHVAFSERIALLAGDALITMAIGTLAELGLRASDAVAVLVRRTGARGLLRGQAVDLELSQRSAVGFEELEELHSLKTGALFAAAAELGGIAAGASQDDRQHLADYGMAIGVAFQHADDRDDGDFAQYAEKARGRIEELTEQAVSLAMRFGPAGRILRVLASWIGTAGSR